MTELTVSRQPALASALDRPLWAALGLNWEKALYAVLIVLAIVTRFYNLGERVISHDESLHTFYSWELAKGKGFIHTPLMHGPLQFHALAFSYTLFGASDYTARIPAAVCGVLAVGLMYFLRGWLGRTGALLAALFFTISPYLMYYTRYAREDPYTLVFQLLMVIALFGYLETKRDRFIYLMSVGLALYFSTKENSFFNAAIWMVFLGLLYLRDMFMHEWPSERYRRFFGFSLTGAGVAAVIAGFLYWYGRYSQWAKDNAPITVQGDEAIRAATNPYLDGMSWALVTLIALLGLAAIFSVLAFREKLRAMPAFNMLIVIFTLIIPHISALPVSLLKLDPLDYSNQGLLRTGMVLLPMLLVTAAIGLVWDWKRWLIAAGIFYGIFVPLFTTMFTNGGGFFTGIVGSLGYWLDQQDVHRGSQPWYYYMLVQVPIYEFLPAIGTLIALGIGVGRWVSAADVPPDTPVEQEKEIRRQQRDRVPVLLFLGFWILAAFGAYSYAGEKMPWLTVHMALPMVLMAGWGFGQVIDAIDWQQLRSNYGWLTLILLPVTIYAALYAVYRLAFSGAPPFQGNELNQLQATMSFLFALLLLVAAGAGTYMAARGLKLSQVGLVGVTLFGALLVFLTARAAIYANFINFDNQTEFINYASGAPGVKTVMAQVEEISTRTTDGMAIRVAYDDDVSWPVTWYMRDFTGQVYYANTPSRETFQDTPLIIAGDSNWAKVEPLLGSRYYTFEYIRMWWPMQEYFNLDKENGWERIRHAITDPDYRKAIFDIWFFRDYKKYGELTGVDYSLSRWPVADRMRFYIRKDIAAQLWPLGLGPSAGQAAVDDPYAINKINLNADAVWGSEGSGEGQFTSPRAVAVGPDGSVYVADTRGHRIQKFTADGQFVSAWGTFGRIEDASAGPGAFNEIWGIAVDSEGFVYATDTWNHRIQKFTAEGEFVTTWGAFGLTDAGLSAMWGPRGIAVDGDANVYVADTGNKRILVFDHEGNPLREIGAGGALDGQLDEPTAVAVSPDGRLFVADTWNQRVQVFTTEGAFVGKWEVAGWISQSLDNKPYIALDDLGRVYVSDPEGYRVIVFSDSGLFQYTFGDFGADSATFGLPTGIAARGSSVYVVDANNHRVLRFTLGGDT